MGGGIGFGWVLGRFWGRVPHIHMKKGPGTLFSSWDHQKFQVMTPVVKKRNHEAKKSMDKSDGTKTNPVISCYDELRLGFAREIKYTQLNGTIATSGCLLCPTALLQVELESNSRTHYSVIVSHN